MTEKLFCVPCRFHHSEEKAVKIDFKRNQDFCFQNAHNNIDWMDENELRDQKQWTSCSFWRQNFRNGLKRWKCKILSREESKLNRKMKKAVKYRLCACNLDKSTRKSRFGRFIRYVWKGIKPPIISLYQRGFVLNVCQIRGKRLFVRQIYSYLNKAYFIVQNNSLHQWIQIRYFSFKPYR